MARGKERDGHDQHGNPDKAEDSKKYKHQYCNGTGTDPHTGKTCQTCNGTGEVG